MQQITQENIINKFLATIVLTGLIATVPALASAHDRGQHDRDRAHQHRGDPDSHQRHGHYDSHHRHGHYDSRQHRGHQDSRQHRGHHHANDHDVRRAPVVHYPAPRVGAVLIPAFPFPHVNIVWPIGHRH